MDSYQLPGIGANTSSDRTAQSLIRPTRSSLGVIRDYASNDAVITLGVLRIISRSGVPISTGF